MRSNSRTKQTQTDSCKYTRTRAEGVGFFAKGKKMNASRIHGTVEKMIFSIDRKAFEENAHVQFYGFEYIMDVKPNARTHSHTHKHKHVHDRTSTHARTLQMLAFARAHTFKNEHALLISAHYDRCTNTLTCCFRRVSVASCTVRRAVISPTIPAASSCKFCGASSPARSNESEVIIRPHISASRTRENKLQSIQSP